jgi:hypothetical protein
MEEFGRALTLLKGGDHYQVEVINVQEDHSMNEDYVMGKLIKPEIKDLPKLADLRVGPGGKMISKEEYARLTSAGCAYCTDAVDDDEHEDIMWIGVEAGKPEPLCMTCTMHSHAGRMQPSDMN